MIKSVNKIAILGTGLIGGSIALGLKKKLGNKLIILGSCNDANRALKAQQQGVIDKIIRRVNDIPNDIQLIILSSPINDILKNLTSLGNSIKQKVLIIDVGSTKRVICEHAKKVLPPNLAFIGTHPMCGREISGFENSDANLFEGKPWIICQNKSIKKNDLNKVIKLVTLLGAKPIMMTPEEHDKRASVISHLPLIVSSILISVANKNIQSKEIKNIITQGFLDSTRLAGHSSVMKTEIIKSNNKYVVSLLKNVNSEVTNLIKIIEKDDANSLMNFFSQIQHLRNQLLGSVKE